MSDGNPSATNTLKKNPLKHEGTGDDASEAPVTPVRIDLPDEVRLSKAEGIRARGQNPFPNHFRSPQTIAEVSEGPRRIKEVIVAANADAWELERESQNAALAGTPVRIAGRIMARRMFGKGIFVEIQDRSGRVQVLLGKNQLTDLENGGQDFEFFKRELDIGDFIGVQGALFFTRTGELTVQATYASLLSKALRPLPEKWHGLQDVETRYRQRYVDLIVNPDVREIFRKRSATVKAIRRFLDARDYLEVETPMLHPIAGGAAARPFSTHHNALNMQLFMRIAPELYLKRLVVGGFERVYEINRNFRNEGLSRRHNPEFTMLEFYQAYATYEDLMDMTEELIAYVAQEVNGTTTVEYEGREVMLGTPWKRLALRDSLVEVAGLTRDEVNSVEALRAKLRTTNIPLKGNEPLGKLQTLVFEELVEPQLWHPTFVYGFPVEVSPLARRNDADPAITDRFELFVTGREIANAFSELNDPEDQRQRFLAQVEARDAGDDEATEYDADYIRALLHGMPPTAGEGIGIDRLVMLLTGAPSIRDVILFPHMRPESL